MCPAKGCRQHNLLTANCFLSDFSQAWQRSDPKAFSLRSCHVPQVDVNRRVTLARCRAGLQPIFALDRRLPGPNPDSRAKPPRQRDGLWRKSAGIHATVVSKGGAGARNGKGAHLLSGVPPAGEDINSIRFCAKARTGPDPIRRRAWPASSRARPGARSCARRCCGEARPWTRRAAVRAGRS